MSVDQGRLFGRGVAFPPRLGADGRWAWSEGPQNIRESIRVVLATERRERLRLPAFGTRLRAMLFQPNVPATHRLLEEDVRNALARWEGRVRLESVSAESAPDDAAAAVLTVTYALVVTGAREQVSLTLQLER